MSVVIDISVFLSYLSSTSNLALSCVGFHRLVISNGFPIITSKGCLCLENLAFYKLLNYPRTDEWLSIQVFEAIEDNDPEHLQLLLDCGADIETENTYGASAMSVAASYGRLKCLKLLLSQKANIDAKDNYGDTALIEASRHGQTDCVHLLLQEGVDIEAENKYENRALNWAAIRGETDCMRLLLDARATVDSDIRKNYPQYAHLWGP